MRKRRRTMSLLIVLVACAGGSLLLAGSAAAAIDVEPLVQFLDRGVPSVDKAATDAIDGSTSVRDYLGNAAADQEANRLLYGFDPEEEAPTSEEIRNDTDWCMWSALTQSAVQITGGDTTSDDGTQLTPAQILASNISPCLSSHLDATGDQINTLTNTLVMLAQNQSGSQNAPNWSSQDALTYYPNGWANWFNYAASTIPPAS